MTTTKQTPAFRKGDLVTYFAIWDRKGTVSFRHAVVYACGLKQMILTDAVSGEEIGRNFQPVRAIGFEFGTRERMTDEAATALALKLAAQFLVEERARLEGHIERNLNGTSGSPFSAGYDRAIKKDIAELHEPRAASIEVLHAEVAAKVNADILARRAR